MLKLKNKKFLYILYGDGPSFIVRALVYKEEFEKRGIQVDYYRLNSQFISRCIHYFSFFYPIQMLFRALNKLFYIKQQYFLYKRVRSYDVIIAVKYIESKLLKNIKQISKALLIYDFDDAVWLNMFYGEEEFSKKVSFADYVTSDNTYLASHASIYNKKSFVVNGPSQIEKFIINNNERPLLKNNDRTIVLGWIGSPSSIFYLYKIYDALELIGEKYSNVILKIVGTGKDQNLIPPFEKIKVVSIPSYDQAEMIKQVFSFDIGLYPLFLNELSLGRGSLKATIYMSSRTPVVCSAIGENLNIIKDEINGFLASDTDEWVEKLSCLIESPALRKEIGKNGFDFVETNYSTENCLNQLFKVISESPD
jgi:glycosyltransferase involved in cell wall biosynthesis